MQKATAPRSDDDLPSEDVLRRIRIPFIRKASLVCEGRAEEVFVIDLGLSGVFVETSSPLPIAATVELTFRLPENEIPLVAQCRVSWRHGGDAPPVSTTLPAGVGLTFVSMPPSDEVRLRGYLTEYYRGQPRSR